jgi:hypothetical protein
MARTTNPKLLKSNDKSKESKGTSARKHGNVVETNATGEAQEVKLATAPDASVVEKTEAEKKVVSQKLLETLQNRRKNQPGNNFGKPPGRRGRRPKAMAEYTPENQEEEGYVLENDHEGIEYETGVRVKKTSEDRGYNLDRFEEYDEELNFDW